MTPEIHVVSVFGAGPGGGNPAPIVADAGGLSAADMRAIAAAHGHESGFVLPAPPGSGCHLALRFWTPNHEMEMCGHATVGALWLLDRLGRLPGDRVSVWTLSGRVDGRIARRADLGARVEVTQPAGEVEPPLDDAAVTEILSVLGMSPADLAPLPIQNARTSRTKTLIPVRSVSVLDALRPDFTRVERLCDRIASTGLYPYAPSDPAAQVFDARQFPRSSGYPEDAATGIAAAALAFGLLACGLVERSEREVVVRQGRAMGRPSEIAVRFIPGPGGALEGCRLGGDVRLEAGP